MPNRTHIAQSLPAVIPLAACLVISCGMPADEDLRPVSRLFAAHSQHEPWDVAAYGILAFQSEVDDASHDRYRLFCEAFLTTFVAAARFENAGTPLSDQMVTIWPLVDDILADHLNSHTGAGRELAPECDEIVESIDLQKSQEALQATKQSLRGKGPYLLAWAPGCAFGKTDNVLLVDLSRIDTLEEAREEFRFWRDEIQKDTKLWSKGWDGDRALRIMARSLERRAPAVLEVLGLSGIVPSP